MGIVMDMSSYETEHDSTGVEYGGNVMHAGLNPAVALSQQQPDAPTNTAISASLATADPELFLRRMNACNANLADLLRNIRNFD